MKKKQHITAFYMEMLLLVAIFIMAILILTLFFSLSRQQSVRAKVLTDAVCLAESTAEMVAASDSEAALLELLEKNGSVQTLEKDGVRIFRSQYGNRSRMESADGGVYQVDVEWIPDETSGGIFVKSIINVYWNGGETPVYTLETAVCLPYGESASRAEGEVLT